MQFDTFCSLWVQVVWGQQWLLWFLYCSQVVYHCCLSSLGFYNRFSRAYLRIILRGRMGNKYGSKGGDKLRNKWKQFNREWKTINYRKENSGQWLIVSIVSSHFCGEMSKTVRDYLMVLWYIIIYINKKLCLINL